MFFFMFYFTTLIFILGRNCGGSGSCNINSNGSSSDGKVPAAQARDATRLESLVSFFLFLFLFYFTILIFILGRNCGGSGSCSINSNGSSSSRSRPVASRAAGVFFFVS
jgi:hypothetical protein